jgi:transposase-like protein
MNEIMSFLKSNGALMELKECTKCSLSGRIEQMKFCTRPPHRTPTWRCTKCNSFASIKEGSFLSSFRFPLTKVLRLIHSWCLELPVVDTANSLNISRPTIISFFRNLQHFALCDFDRENRRIGGEGKIIEIDESLFARVKHNRGKALKRKQIWVFGMLERDSRKCIFYVVEDRKAGTLLPLIRKHVCLVYWYIQICGKHMQILMWILSIKW